MLGLRKKYSPIGVDIGSVGVRAAQLELRGEGVRKKNGHVPGRLGHAVVVAATTTHLDPSIHQDDSGRDSGPYARSLKGEAVKRCVGRVGVGAFRGRRAAVALRHDLLEFHPLELPAAALWSREVSPGHREAQIAKLVRWEVARLRTQPGEAEEIDGAEPVVRHWLLPTPPIAAANVLAVAAPRVSVDEVLEVCAAAGLSCMQVDAGAAALARWGSLLCEWPEDAIWGILDLGYSCTRLILCVRDTPVLVRLAGRGGAAWTERIGQCLQLSPQSAETEKCEHGIEPPRVGQPAAAWSAERTLRGRGGGPGGVGSVRHPQQVVGSLLFGALRTSLKELAAEIKRSYEYVLSCYPRNRAGDLVLVGGGAAMHNLPRYLGDVLGIPVRQARDYCTPPLADACRLTVPEESLGHLHLLACAIGAAIPVDPSGGWSAEDRRAEGEAAKRPVPERTGR